MVEALARMCLPKTFWRVTYEGISDGQHKRMVQKYLRDLDEDGEKRTVKDGLGMILWGKNRRGKTGAAVVVLKQARINGFSGLFITAAKFVSDTFDKVRYDKSILMSQRARKVDFLVLDDMGKEPTGQARTGVLGCERMIENLLRDRHNEGKCTLITMNPNPADLVRDRYGESLLKLMSPRFALVEMAGPSLEDRERRDLLAFFQD